MKNIIIFTITLQIINEIAFGNQINYQNGTFYDH